MSVLVFWLGLAVVMVAYMSVWYGLARYVHRYDVVDTAWGLGFILAAWVALGIRANFTRLTVVSACLVSLWGLRLAVHILSRNLKRSDDDHRYQAIRARWGRAEIWKGYTNIFLLQGGLILLVSTPMLALAFVQRSPNPVTYLGWLVWAGGIICEAAADRQLARFLRQRPAGSHQIMSRGLWAYSRHPNYFGEVASWWGAAVVVCSVGAWWGLLGAVTITWLITKVSGIPPLERHYDGNAAYEAYRRQTSVLIPLPRKKAAGR